MTGLITGWQNIIDHFTILSPYGKLSLIAGFILALILLYCWTLFIDRKFNQPRG